MDQYPYKVMKKLDQILAATDKIAWLFSKAPEKDFSRHRKLPFHKLVKLMIGMEGSSLGHEMLNCFHFSKETPSVSALIQQRTKLLPEAISFVFSAVVKTFPCRRDIDGYRLIACDGSDLHYASNPSETDCFFRLDEQSRGYNLMHLNALYDLYSRRYVDAIIQPSRQRDEVGAFVSTIDRFPADDKTIFTADRGYESYNVMAHIIEKGMYFLLRVRSPESMSMLGKLRLPEGEGFDHTIHIEVTKKQTNLVKANPVLYRFVPKNRRFDFCDLYSHIFYPLDLRVVSVEIAPGQFEYLITNLDDAAFPPDKLKVLYCQRWGIETSFRDLKYTIGLSNFHSKRAEFITQEVFARLILYNLCELVVSHSALFRTTASYVYKLNFSVAVHIFRHAFFLNHDDSPPDVVTLIRKHILPIRPGRNGPRIIKYRSAVSFNYRIA